MRGFLFGWMVAAGVLVGSAGCGKVSSFSGGSNTNWLERCASDAECGSGSQCWCNACTAACATDGDCNGGVCRTTDALGCGVPGVGAVCVAECGNDAECSTLGAEFGCRGGVCLPALGDGTGGSSSSGGSGPGAAGAGDTAGSFGSGGDAPVEPRARRSFDAAADDTCVVTRGQLYCWGDNLYGQTGAPPSERRIDEPRLVNVPEVTQVATNGGHTCALSANGDVYCWGLNDAGQTGTDSAPSNTCPDYVLDRSGDYPCQPTPTRVEGVSDATEVAVGIGASCAVLADASVQCWGAVPAGLLETAASLMNVGHVDLGTGSGCVWGPGGLACSGVLDAPALFPYENLDIQFGGSSNAAEEFGCVLGSFGDVPGNVVCFGNNRFGQYGFGTFGNGGTTTIAVAETKAIAVGDAHACALQDDGQVLCWGRNTTGAVGPAWLASPNCGYDVCEPSPVHVAGLPPIVAIAAGGDRTCAFADDGTLWCWGGDSLDLGAPLRVAGPWEPNGEACESLVNLLGKTLLDGVGAVDHSCVTDADCVEVPLGISCHQTCAMASLPHATADAASLLVSQNESNTCPQLRELGCQEPEVTCPEPTTQPICYAGYCTRADPAHSGCTDHCACSAERSAALVSFQDECEGFDLWPAVAWPCPSCDQAATYVVVMNRGSEGYSGDTTISWVWPEGPDVLPRYTTVSLMLAPGEASTPIRIESDAGVAAVVRVMAEGDCNPDDDATEVMIPVATACD